MAPKEADRCRAALLKAFKLHLGITYGCSSKATEALLKSVARETLPFLNAAEKVQIFDGGAIPLWLDHDALQFFTKKIDLPPGRALRDVVAALPAPVAAAPEPVEAAHAVDAAVPPPVVAVPVAGPRRTNPAAGAFDHFCYLEKDTLDMQAEALAALAKNRGKSKASLIKVAAARRWRKLSADYKTAYGKCAAALNHARVRDGARGYWTRIAVHGPVEEEVEEVAEPAEPMVTPRKARQIRRADAGVGKNKVVKYFPWHDIHQMFYHLVILTIWILIFGFYSDNI